MLLLYFVCFKRGGSSFSCKRSPLYICFIPQNIFVKQKISYFCISFFFSCGKLDCKLFVYWKTSFFCSFVTCSCIGDKGGEWAVIAVRVSSFQFLITKNANEGTEELWENRRFLLSSPFFLYFRFFFEKRISRRLQGQKPQVLGAFLWGILCTLFCEELGTKAALLSSASRLCQNLNAQSNGRIYPWGLLVPPGGWKD